MPRDGAGVFAVVEKAALGQPGDAILGTLLVLAAAQQLVFELAALIGPAGEHFQRLLAVKCL